MIALTPTLRRILARRRVARVPGCELIFHHSGRPITDYRKAWQSACALLGLGKFYCRDCQSTMLDAQRTCPKCGRKYTHDHPKYQGKLFHDFRRSAAHELWRGGASTRECMEVTGHKTESMFRRYADLFSNEERIQMQLEAQRRRQEWRRQQSTAMKPTARVQ